MFNRNKVDIVGLYCDCSSP